MVVTSHKHGNMNTYTARELSPCLASKASGLCLGSGTVVAPSGGRDGKQKNCPEGRAANTRNVQMKFKTSMMSLAFRFHGDRDLECVF